MAKYRITGPDGGTYEVTAPDNASEADVLAYAKQNYQAKPAEPAPNPTEGQSFGQNAAAGAGKAMADAGRGAVLRSGQALSNAPNTLPLLKLLNISMEKAGLSPTAGVEEAKEGIAESRKLDAPLMKTGGGVAGNIGANAAMLAPTAGANTPASAGLIGSLAGFAQPALDAKESLLNTVLGWAGGAGGQWLAGKAVPKTAAQTGAINQKFAAAQAGAKEGYVVPPADLQPGVLSEVVSGFGGKIKTAQVASQRNQGVTDKLARKAVGLNPSDELTADALQTIRRQAAAKGYDPIKSAGAVQSDQAFFKALDDIASTQQGAARSFPGLGDNGVAEMIAKLKQPGFDAGDAIDATKVLREVADKAYRQGDPTLGKAAKQASDALEGMLERHLTASGQADALKSFREARQLIAKTYTVQKGLNSQTGNVSANALAKQLEKGKPLTDELRTIAEMGSAFPKATQTLKEAPKSLSPLDIAMAAGGVGTGNPLLLAWLGRPVARSVMLSGPVQTRALQQSAPGNFGQLTQAALGNRLSQIMLGPVGTAGGLQVAQ